MGLAALLFLAGCAGSCGPAPEAAPATPTTAPVSLPPPLPGPVVGADGLPSRFALGVNEALSVPFRAVRDQGLGGEALRAHLREDARLARSIGVVFVRGNSGAFPRSSWFSQQREPEAATNTDTWVQEVQAGGFEPILMISPWPGNRTANVTERYVPEDMDGYLAWVRRTVERYDHDGIDDMPGLLAPIRYWEVDNEPDLKFTVPPRDAVRDVPPGSFCSPAEAARVLVATSTAIKGAFPDARVLNGGIYRPFAENGKSYLRALFAEPGVPAAIDILSLHSYASDEQGNAFADGLATAREISGGKPIFVTETSVADRGDERWMSAAWQARMVATVAARGAANGARAVLWHTLADPPPRAGERNSFSRNSLFARPEGEATEEKPAAQVFRNLSARLAADDLSGATADGDGAVRAKSGAVLLYEGERTARSGGIDLVSGLAIPPGGPAAAPAWLWP